MITNWELFEGMAVLNNCDSLNKMRSIQVTRQRLRRCQCRAIYLNKIDKNKGLAVTAAARCMRHTSKTNICFLSHVHTDNTYIPRRQIVSDNEKLSR